MSSRLRYWSGKLTLLCILLCGLVLSGCATSPKAFDTTEAVLASASGYYEEGIVVELADGSKIKFEGPTYVLSAETYRALMLTE